MIKYYYTYDIKKGYHLEPEDNTNIINLLPKNNKLTGIVRVCYKNGKLYIFEAINQEKQDRDLDLSYEISIYDLEDFDLNNLDIKTEIENYSLLFDILKNLDKKATFDFKEDFLPFLIILTFKKEICFDKKEVIITPSLSSLEKCLINLSSKYDLTEILKSYYEFVNENKINSYILECFNFNEINKYIKDECKKEVVRYLEKYGELSSFKRYILELDCTELKRKFLKKIIDKLNDKKIDNLFKCLDKKLFVIGF